MHGFQDEIGKGDVPEEGSGGSDDADGSDAEDTAEVSSSTSTPNMIKGVWWLERGGCYQAKRRIELDDGEHGYQWKRFKPESHSVTDLCRAHEDARQWAAS